MFVKLSMICSKQSNDTYFAICPEISGCFTQGDTYEETVVALKELVEITVREELTADEVEKIQMSSAKIFSEFEVAI